MFKRNWKVLALLIFLFWLYTQTLPSSRERWLHSLKDKSSYTRESAAKQLGQSKDPQAVEPLLEVALKDESDSVREKAAEALAIINDPRAVQALVAALDDKSESMQWAAAHALGKFKDPRAVESLMAALRDKDDSVRVEAAQALGRIKDPRAVESLMAALKDKGERVRVEAAQALGRIKDPRAVQALMVLLRDNDSPSVRIGAARALGAMGDSRALEDLEAAFRDKNAGVRLAAVGALKDINGPGVVKPLIAALNDVSGEVRRVAGEALLLHGGDQANTALAAHLADWYLGPMAVQAMKNQGKIPPAPELEIHWWVAEKIKNKLLSNWERTREVLLRDIHSGSTQAAENALMALVGLGRDEMIPVLVEELALKGNITIAMAYVNSGNKILDDAGTAWARSQGYQLLSMPDSGGSGTRWGGM
jgi:HEAT repeat protein